MKYIIYNRSIYLITLTLLSVVMVSNISTAENSLNYLVVSGQVTNSEYGNPVEGHLVYIKSDSTYNGFNGYSNSVYTDIEGYYYDTIRISENKGSFEVYTHDHFGTKIDTTVHFRFLEKSNSMLIADFNIFLPHQPEELQATFKYVRDINGNRNDFNFFDQTTNNNIVSWYWEFGDGNTSTLQNPNHTYLSYGLFKVSLTVTAFIGNYTSTSTITKQLYISVIEFHHMGGHVFSEYFPIDMGYAYLYYIDSNKRYIPIDTMAFDTLGYYYFYQIPVGNYIVKAEPMYQSGFYGKLLPTYFGKTLYWEEAEIIPIISTSWEYNINLEHVESYSSGNGNINGNVEYVGPDKYLNGYSAKGVNLHLFDENDNLITCRYSDDYGDFSFDYIELNTYWIYPEVTGIPSNRTRVELTPETPTVSNIEINLLHSSISSIINESAENEIVGLPFPNPSAGKLSIPVTIDGSSIISYEIYNILGDFIESENINSGVTNGVYNISTKNLDNGTYIIRTIVDDQIFNRVFILLK